MRLSNILNLDLINITIFIKNIIVIVTFLFKHSIVAFRDDKNIYLLLFNNYVI